MNLSDIKSKLSEAGMKATHQRMVVFDSVMSLNNHPTVDKIYEDIKDKIPSISVATIYRVLEDFVSAGLMHKVSSKQGTMRYDANMEPHSHIYCTNTHDIFDYDSQELNSLITDFLSKKNIKNFKVSEIKLQINGEKIDPESNISID